MNQLPTKKVKYLGQIAKLSRCLLQRLVTVKTYHEYGSNSLLYSKLNAHSFLWFFINFQRFGSYFMHHCCFI